MNGKTLSATNRPQTGDTPRAWLACACARSPLHHFTTWSCPWPHHPVSILSLSLCPPSGHRAGVNSLLTPQQGTEQTWQTEWRALLFGNVSQAAWLRLIRGLSFSGNVDKKDPRRTGMLLYLKAMLGSHSSFCPFLSLCSTDAPLPI